MGNYLKKFAYNNAETGKCVELIGVKSYLYLCIFIINLQRACARGL